MTDVTLRPVIKDDLEWIVEHHAQLYARDDGFDASFGPLVRALLVDFFANHSPKREAGWIAEQGDTRLGCIFCVTLSDTTAKLRMFLTIPKARGIGLGKRLLATCTEFARASGYSDMSLWTHESHTAACALYARSGWTLTHSEPVHSFGQDLVEQTWVRTL